MYQHYLFHNIFLWEDMNNKAVHVCLEKMLRLRLTPPVSQSQFFPIIYHSETFIFLVIVREMRLVRFLLLFCCEFQYVSYRVTVCKHCPSFLCASWTALSYRSDKAAAFPPPPWPGQTATLHLQTLASTSASSFPNVGMAARCSM